MNRFIFTAGAAARCGSTVHLYLRAGRHTRFDPELKPQLRGQAIRTAPARAVLPGDSCRGAP